MKTATAYCRFLKWLQTNGNIWLFLHSYKHRGKISLYLSHLVNMFTEISRGGGKLMWADLSQQLNNWASTTGQRPQSLQQILFLKKNVWRTKSMFRNYPNNINITLKTDENWWNKHEEAPGQEMLHVDVWDRRRDEERDTSAKAGRTTNWCA